MSGHTVKAFRHKGKVYDHIIFSRDDDRIELQNESGECLLTFTANCYVINPDGKYYGRISMRDGFWYFIKDNDFRYNFEQHGNDLLSAEVEISKMFLDEMGA